MTRLLVSALVGGILATAPAAVRADPLVISGGYLIFDHEGDFFFLTGDGFRLHGTEPFYHFPKVLAQSCSVCVPGDLVDASFRTPGEVYLGSGFAEIGGRMYRDVAWHGALDVAVPAIPFPETDEFTAFPTAPFSFSGTLRALHGPDELFASALTGAGRMSLPYFLNGWGQYEWEEGRLNYIFAADQPAPVPEPATLTLLATGLGMALLGRRKKKPGGGLWR